MDEKQFEQQFKELKQFISGAIFQSEERVKAESKADLERLRAEMVTKDEFDKSLRALESKIDDRFTGVGDAIEHLGNELISETHKTSIRLDDHDTRLSTLEQTA